MKLWDKGFTYDLPKDDSSWDRGVQGQTGPGDLYDFFERELRW